MLERRKAPRALRALKPRTAQASGREASARSAQPVSPSAADVADSVAVPELVRLRARWVPTAAALTGVRQARTAAVRPATEGAA